MSVLCDRIEEFIKQAVAESPQVVLCRRELAAYFGCAPSQINYVLTTRFMGDPCYAIESKRGGGGYIRIARINIDREACLAAVIRRYAGGVLGAQEAGALINSLAQQGILTAQEALLMRAAVADRALKTACKERDALRASVLTSMLLALAGCEKEA